MLNILGLLALAGFVSAAPSSPTARRAVNEIMYAYGINITGLPIFMDNQMAYIGNLSYKSTPTWASDASEVLWTTSTSTTTPWTVQKLNSADTTAHTFYVNTAASSYAQAGFAIDTAAFDPSLATTGFTYMGSEVAYAASATDYQEKFWAKATNATGIWELMWNVDGMLQEESVPIMLKSFAPPEMALQEYESACEDDC